MKSAKTSAVPFRTRSTRWKPGLRPIHPPACAELDLLKVRSRDVLERIERVVHHVRRLEQSTETVVQMHFSVQSNRTNDIMRTLTALTAVFLPLNLIAGIFGMNFELHAAHPQARTASGGPWRHVGDCCGTGATFLAQALPLSHPGNKRLFEEERRRRCRVVRQA